MRFSGEVFGFILIFVLLLQFLGRGRNLTSASRLFRNCLLLSALAIGLYLLGSMVTPLWGRLLLHTAYFLAVTLVSTLLVRYLFHQLLFHAYSDAFLKKVHRLVYLGYGLLVVLALVNLKTGLIFSFDSNAVIRRGVLGAAGFALGFLELFILLYFCRRQPNVYAESRWLLRWLLALVGALAVMQHFFPHLLLVGATFSFVELIIFLHFQSRLIELDPLTGLGTYKSFLADLYRRLTRRQHFHLVMIGLQNFSAVNRTCGHRVSDEYLYAICRWLESTFPHASFFRFSPVVFVGLFPALSGQQQDEIITAIRRRFSLPWFHSGRLTLIECRMADLAFAGEMRTAAQVVDLLEYVRVEMKAARSDYYPIGEDTVQRVERQEQLSAQLRTALSQGRFEVYFQPIFSKKDRCFRSAEALIRMHDMQGALIPPDEFIPLAEKSGLIDQITWFVIEQSCRLLAETPDLTVRSISVNVTMPQLCALDFLPRLEKTLAQWGLPHEAIKLELTERELIQDAALGDRVVERLSKHGFCFYLDDFGTGYSNFARLLSMPLEYVKLDKSLLAILDTQDNYTLSSLIDLLHHGGMGVVVEGVETAEQAKRLLTLGADQLQGFFFSRPVPVKDLLPVLSTFYCPPDL